MSWSFTVICSQLTGNWPGKLRALYSCWTGLSTSLSNWPQSPELWSSWTTCKQPTPVWWVFGSRPGPIIKTCPSFISSRMFLRKTQATGPAAWMLLTSSCSRTPGTCPKSPTWTSKYTRAVMACWQLPIPTPRPPGPRATWWLTSTSQQKICLGKTLFPDEDLRGAFAYGPTTQAWGGGPSFTARRSLAAAAAATAAAGKGIRTVQYD